MYANNMGNVFFREFLILFGDFFWKNVLYLERKYPASYGGEFDIPHIRGKYSTIKTNKSRRTQVMTVVK